MKILLCLLGLIMSKFVTASAIENVKISQLAINSSYGNYVFIQLERSPSRIPCSINGTWDYTLSLDGEKYKAMYSMLLAAHMAQKDISISGLPTPACNEFPSVESVNTLHIK